ncbi:MAG TPA: YdcF family protein [Puia sp.]|nr:YdcF family protein [Puia sp.]
MILVVVKLVLILATVFLGLTIISSCSFSAKASKELYNKASNEQFDLIIVPGAPFQDGRWGRVVKGRIYWAKFLFDKGIAKNVMFSGSSVYSPYTESVIMSLYAQAVGIPKENIFIETKAEHTTENVYYSYQKALQLGFKKIAIASDPFQTKMVRRFARNKVSPDIQLIPFVVDTLKEMQPTMKDPEIDYQQAFIPDFKSIVKRESFWKRLKGTMGKNIDKSAYR